MASSNQTPKLGLSQWSETDCPQREDFVQDNQKLETLLGGHLNSTALHLTATQKAFVTEPYRLVSYAGNGNNRSQLSVNFPVRFVIIIAQGKAPFYQRDGYRDVYWTCWSENWGGTGCDAISVTSSALTVMQQTVDQVKEGQRYCLNESGVRYAAYLMR